MPHSDIRPSGLPVPLMAAGPKPSLMRNAVAATFVSQLLAERDRPPPQKQRRRGSAEGAIGAYSAGATVAVVRMPAGYRTTIVA